MIEYHGDQSEYEDNVVTNSLHCTAPVFKDGKDSSRSMVKYTIGWEVLLEPPMLIS